MIIELIWASLMMFGVSVYNVYRVEKHKKELEQMVDDMLNPLSYIRKQRINKLKAVPQAIWDIQPLFFKIDVANKGKSIVYSYSHVNWW